MLYSRVAMIPGFSNAPDYPELALDVGRSLCEELLEPLQERWGRVAIRSAYRSPEVNAFCCEMQKRGKAGYTCASNEANYSGHIWDRRDASGHKGAPAGVVGPGVWD